MVSVPQEGTVWVFSVQSESITIEPWRSHLKRRQRRVQTHRSIQRRAQTEEHSDTEKHSVGSSDEQSEKHETTVLGVRVCGETGRDGPCGST